MPVEFSNDNKQVRLIQTCANHPLSWRNINPEIRNLCQDSIQIIENNFQGFCWYLNNHRPTEWGYGPAGLGDSQFNIGVKGRFCIWCYPHRIPIAHRIPQGITMNMCLWFAKEKLDLLRHHPKYIANEFNHGSFYGLEIHFYKSNGGWYYIEYSEQDNYEELIVELCNILY